MRIIARSGHFIAYLLGVTALEFIFAAASKTPPIFPRRPHRALGGAGVFHRRDGNLNTHDHRHPRHRLRRESHFSSTGLRLLIGRVLIVLLLLPGYFRGEFFTAYALIEKRFGERMRAVAASTFLITPRDCRRRPRSAIALSSASCWETSEKLAVVIVIASPCLYNLRRRHESGDLD